MPTSHLLAFSYPNLSKADFLKELQAHADADRFVQGAFSKVSPKKGFRGCAIGCSLHSIQQHLGLLTMAYDQHAAYETYLGIPRVLARLEDRIFESLPLAEAKLWPMHFAEAVPEGADLSNIWNQFAPWLLREFALPAANIEEVRAAISTVAEGYETGWKSISIQKAQRLVDALTRPYEDSTPAQAAIETVYAATSAITSSVETFYAAIYAADTFTYASIATTPKDKRQHAVAIMANKLLELLAAAPVVCKKKA